MTIYLLIVIFEYLFYKALIASRQYPLKQCRTVVFIVSFFLLYILSALRADTVGGDLERYLPEFEAISGMSLRDVVINGYDDRERLFAILEKLISYISNNHQFYLIVTSSIFICLAYNAIKKFSLDLFTSLIIFTCLIYTPSFNTIRASLTIAIGLNLYAPIVRRDFKKFLLLIILAFCIQHTSIIMLPMYFLWDLKYRPRLLIILMTVALAISFVISGSWIIDVINMYTGSNVGGGYAEYWAESSGGLTNFAYMLIFMTGLLMYLYKRQMKRSKQYELFIHFMVVATCIQFFSSVFFLLNRLGAFYYSFLIFAVPYVIRKEKIKDRYLLRYIFVAICLMVYLSGLIKDGHMIVPYEFCF